MSALFAFLNSGAAVGAAIWELLQYGWRFLENVFLPKAVLAARVLAAESQLALCQERLESQGVRRHRFSDGFRWLWVLLAGCWGDWQRYARLMQPATVKRWHEWGFRLFSARTLRTDFHANLGSGFDGRCCRFLGVDYSALRDRVLAGGTDDEILTWCFDHGTRPNEEQVLVWNKLMLKRGWRDEDDRSTQELEPYKASSGLTDRTDILTFG